MNARACISVLTILSALLVTTVFGQDPGPVIIHTNNKRALSGEVVSHDELSIRLRVSTQYIEYITEIPKQDVLQITQNGKDVTADYLSADQMDKIERERRLNKIGLITAIVGLPLAILIWYIGVFLQHMSATCFSAGTKVLLADGSSKNIESLEVGDQVLSCNLDTGQTEADEVVELYSPINNNMVRMEFSDGTVIHSTFDHPYYVQNKGWCSLKPDVTNDLITNITDVDQLEVGDVCHLLKDGQLTEVEFVGSKRLPTFQLTYTIKKLKKNNTFFAEGVLVGVETVRER